MRVIKMMLKTIAGILAVLAVAVVAVFGYNLWLIGQRSVEAREAASSFCAGVPAGSDIELAIARADERGIRHAELEAGALYEFPFMYFLDGWACRVEVSGGAVVHKQVVSAN